MDVKRVVVFDNEFGRCVVDETEYGPCAHFKARKWSPSCYRLVRQTVKDLTQKYQTLYAVSPKDYDEKWLKFVVMLGFEFLDIYDGSCVLVHNRREPY